MENESVEMDATIQNELNKEAAEPSFTYTYSAKEQDEVKKIRDKYVPKEPDKLEQLRMLDKSVTRKGTKVSIALGVIGALILGMGMSLTMTEIGVILGLEMAMVPGIILGVIGMAMAGCAYPLYNCITKREREKLAPEILRLTEELMK